MKITYRIKNGKHYHSNLLARLLFLNFKKKFVKKECLNMSCWYDEKQQTNIGWNKLTGVSGLLVHKDSARIVWRPTANYGEFQIAAYSYVARIRIVKKICIVKANSWFDIEISKTDKKWIYKINEHFEEIEASRKPMYIKLGFHFGGQEVAPHDMYMEEK